MTETAKQDGWNILQTATGQNAARAEVFDVLKAELPNFASTVADDLIQRSKKPFHSTVLNFEVSQAQGRYLTIPHRDVYNSRDMSLSFTIRQVKYTQQSYQSFIQHRNATQGWNVLQQACMSYMSIASTSGQSSNSGHGAPSDVLNEWVRCTYTVGANGCISLYVDDFLMYQAQGANPPPFSNQVVPGNAIMVGREKSYTAGASREIDSIWQMSDIILYNRVLTPNEVFEYGTSSLPAKDPVGHWTLNGTSKDASVNQNDATRAPGNEPAFIEYARLGP
nr:LamG domain-containing protein [Rugamonas sp. CCM 8940]